MANDTTFTTWRARVFAATWLSYAGYYFCRKPFFIAKHDVEVALQLDPETLSWLGTSYLVAYAVGQFISGWLGTRLGPRVLLLGGMLVTIAANIGFGLTNSFHTFATLMFINGLAQASGWPGNVGIIGQWFSREQRGTVMGFWGTHFQVGGIAANSMSAWMLGSWGFRWSFFTGAAVLFAVWAFFVFNGAESPEKVGLPAVRDEHEQEDVGPRGGWSRDLIVNVMLIGVFYFFVKFIRYALWSWAPYVLESHYGLKGDAAGYLSTTFDVTGIFGVVAIGWISDRFFGASRAKASFVFVLAMVASCVVLYWMANASLGWFTVAIGLIGFSLYGPDALMSGAGAIDVGSRRTAVMAAGVINGMGSCGSVVQELLLGRMLKGPDAVEATFGVLLASSIASALCLGVIVLRDRTGHAHV